MRTLTIVALGLGLIAAPAASYAKSASAMSPGHEMQRMGRSVSSPGASRFAPGHEMKASRFNRGPGASQFAPGHRKGW